MPERDGWFIEFWRIITYTHARTLAHTDTYWLLFHMEWMHLASKKRSDCTTCNSKVDTRPRSYNLVDFLLCTFSCVSDAEVNEHGCTASAIDRATCLIAVNSTDMVQLLLFCSVVRTYIFHMVYCWTTWKMHFQIDESVSSWVQLMREFDTKLNRWWTSKQASNNTDSFSKPPFRIVDPMAHSFRAIMVDCHVYLFILRRLPRRWRHSDSYHSIIIVYSTIWIKPLLRILYTRFFPIAHSLTRSFVRPLALVYLISIYIDLA